MKIWHKLLLCLGLLILAFYLAGGLFLQMYDRDFLEATPITWFQYWIYYSSESVKVKFALIGSLVFSLAMAFLPFYKKIFSREKKSSYGDARLATKKEIGKAGLFSSDGIIIGKLFGMYLTINMLYHILMCAPTGGGKGVGYVIPNLLTIKNSVVCLDIKRENWDITSAYRAKYGQKCFLFDPASVDGKTHQWNPLYYISDHPGEKINDIQKIANMLFPDVEGTDPIWTATPRALFMGVVLMLLETPEKPVTIGQVLRETLQGEDPAKYFSNIVNTRADSGNPLSGECITALSTYISIDSKNTRSGVMSSFRSRLELWMNPLIDAATSGNSFDFRDIRRKAHTIHLAVTPDNLARLQPIINLFFQQLLDINTRALPNKENGLNVRLDVLLDEFVSVGKVPILSKGAAYFRGYNIRLSPVIQAPSQLDDVYGKEAAKTFRINHDVQIFFPPKASDYETAEAISKWIGTETIESKSKSKGKNWFKSNQKSENVSERARALFLPQEITRLSQDKCILIVQGLLPIIANKVRYYKDPVFINRLKEVSPSLKALGKKMPTQEQLETATAKGELAAPVPTLDISSIMLQNQALAPTRLNIASSNQTAENQTETVTETVVVEREVTSEDLVNLKDTPLDSFVVDFSDLTKPDFDATEEQLLEYADKMHACINP